MTSTTHGWSYILPKKQRKPLDPWPPLCFVVVLLMPVHRILSGAPELLWSGLIAAVMVGAVLMGAARRPVAAGAWIAAAFFTMLGVIASSDSPENPEAHWLVGLQLLFFVTLSPWAARGILTRSPKSVRAAGVALILGQSMSAAAALAQSFGATVAGFSATYGRSPGLAGHTNILGLLAGVVVVLCTYLVITKHKRKVSLVLAAILNAGGLVASGSVSSLIACALGVFVVLIALRVRLRVPILITASAAGLLYFVNQFAATHQIRTPFERIQQVTGQTDKIATWEIRQATYAFAWEHIQAHPILGAGLDDASGATYDNFTLTHNVLIRAWFQGGLGVGLAFLILYAVFAGVVLLSLKRGMNALPAAMLTVIASFSLTSAALHQEYYWMLLAGAWSLVQSPLDRCPVHDDPQLRERIQKIRQSRRI